MVAALGAASVQDAVRAARAAGMTALMLATVSDFAVLRPDPVTGLRAHRDFRPGEAYADHRRQLEAIRRGVAAAGAEVKTVRGCPPSRWPSSWRPQKPRRERFAACPVWRTLT
jgi:hypothetical protein